MSVRGASEFRVLERLSDNSYTKCRTKFDDSDEFGQFGRSAIISFGPVTEISAKTAVRRSFACP